VAPHADDLPRTLPVGERAAAGHAIGAPFGQLLRENEALRITDGEAFARWVLGHEAAFPEAYRTIKAVNVGLHPLDEGEAEELEAGEASARSVARVRPAGSDISLYAPQREGSHPGFLC